MRKWIGAHPEATIISVSQNDTINNCQCDNCRAVDDAEGSPAGSLLKFVNAIRGGFGTRYPSVRIDTLAYQYTESRQRTPAPPERHRAPLLDRMLLAHPLETCSSEANRQVPGGHRRLAACRAPSLRLGLHSEFRALSAALPELRLPPGQRALLRPAQRQRLVEQGNYSAGGQGEMGPLRAYILAKLLWDPNTDVQKHSDEFVQAYFGAAGGQIKPISRWNSSRCAGKECHAHIFDKSAVCYLNDDFLRQADAILDMAEQQAEPGAIPRSGAGGAPPDLVCEARTNRVTGDARSELVRQFLTVAREAGCSNISEGMTLDDWAGSRPPRGEGACHKLYLKCAADRFEFEEPVPKVGFQRLPSTHHLCRSLNRTTGRQRPR